MNLIKVYDRETCEVCPVFQSGGWIHEGGYNILIQPNCLANSNACNPDIAVDIRPEIEKLLRRHGLQLTLTEDKP